MNDQVGKIRDHIDAALVHLKIDGELDRLANPRHTDHDRHVYLPNKIKDAIAAARREIEAALDELSGGA